MTDSIDVFRSRLAALLSKRGAKAEFSRRNSIPRPQLDKWLAGEAGGTLDTLDRAARGLGIQPWELLKPDDAKPTPAPAEALAAAALSDPVLRKVLTLWPQLDDVGKDALLIAAEDLLREQNRRKGTPQNSSSAKGAR